MTLSAGVGVCAKAPKAATSAAAKPTAFQPANMRIIIPLVSASVHHGPVLSGAALPLANASFFMPFITRQKRLRCRGRLLGGRIRTGAHRRGFTAEGQPEFLG